jgi:hypothetical protein
MVVRRTWIGWCLLLGFVASCATSNDTSGTGGAGGAATGGKSGAAGTTTGQGGGGGSTGEGGAAGASAGSGGGQVVDTSGGYVMQSGVALNVPSDAVSAPTTITVVPTTAPAGYTLASQAYQFGPSGTVFAQPVVVTMPVNNGGIGVHMFWSNAGGGFDDIGGTVSGSTISASVTHFSVGFCAVVSGGGSGAGGSAASGGASGTSGRGGAAGSAAAGAAGGTSTGAGGSTSPGSGGSSTSSGAGGSTSAGGSIGTGGSTSGAGGSSGAAGSAGAAGSSGTGAAGSSGAGGTSGPTDAGLGPDAESSLCKTAPLNLPGATLNYPEGGAAPAPSTYTGGTLPSGKYYLRSVTQYGGGTYAGTRQEQLTIDPVARTLVYGAYLPTQQGSAYWVMTYEVVGSNTLQVTVQCSNTTSPTGTFDMYYTANTVNGTTVTLTTAGSSDVLSYY